MKAPHARWTWIQEYLRNNPGDVDVLNTDFVLGFWEFSECKAAAQFYGAPRCPRLGRDLSEMYRAGFLKRSRCGLHGLERGFPKWVWTYGLSDEKRKEGMK